VRWALRLTFWADAVLMGEGSDLTVALEARAWWWCLWLGGRGGGACGLGGFWASVSHDFASPSQGDGSPKMSHVIPM